MLKTLMQSFTEIGRLSPLQYNSTNFNVVGTYIVEVCRITPEKKVAKVK